MYSRLCDGLNASYAACAFLFFLMTASIDAGAFSGGFSVFVRGALAPASASAFASFTIRTRAASEGRSSVDSKRPNCPIASPSLPFGAVFISAPFQNPKTWP